MRKGLGLAGLIVGVPLPLCFVPWLLSGGVARKPLYLVRKLIRVGILSLILTLIPKSVGSRSAQSLCRASMSCERKTVSLIAWNSRHKAMPPGSVLLIAWPHADLDAPGHLLGVHDPSARSEAETGIHRGLGAERCLCPWFRSGPGAKAWRLSLKSPLAAWIRKTSCQDVTKAVSAWAMVWTLSPWANRSRAPSGKSCVSPMPPCPE